MAVKTITIDMEAYKRLKRAKRGKESFSDVIKRRVPKPFDFDAFIKRVEKNSLGDKFADNVEKIVAQRRRGLPVRRRHGLS